MKNVKKTLLLCLCAAALMTATVLGTLAWLTDRDAVTNTFTVGKVDIDVDEAAVTPDGEAISGAARVRGNSYHLLPGQTYVKDPTLTVKGGSEDAYVRMMLTLNRKSVLDDIFAPGVALETIFNGYQPTEWVYVTATEDDVADTVTYEFRYKEIVASAATSQNLPALFASFTIPDTVTGEQLGLLLDDPATAVDEGFKITVEGDAIQSVGFENADPAFAENKTT